MSSGAPDSGAIVAVMSSPHHVALPDPVVAVAQWERLAATLEGLGAEIVLLPDDPARPLRAYTRDLALPLPGGDLVVPSPRRRREGDDAALRVWLTERGVRWRDGPPLTPLEGGDVIVGPSGVLVGRGPISSGAGGRWLTRTHHQAPVIEVPHRHAQMAHLDQLVAPLGDRAWLAHPASLPGWDGEAWRALRADRPVIELTAREVASLAANVVVLGSTVVGHLPPRVADAIASVGLTPAPVELSGLIPARGGARCLTLVLEGTGAGRGGQGRGGGGG